MSEHLTDPELSALLDEEDDLEDFVPRVLHLVTCTTCRYHFRQSRPDDVSILAQKVFGQRNLPPIPHRRDESSRWHDMLARCSSKIDQALEERKRAVGLWRQVAPLPAHRRWLEVLNRDRFHTLGFIYRILEEVDELQSRDPRDAETWCDLALEVTKRLPDARYGAGPLHDVRARLYAFRGNCRRICNDLAAADRNFHQAELHLEQGLGEPLEQALVYRMESSLRRDQRRFEEARELLGFAAKIYRSLGDGPELANVTIKEAILCRDRGEPEVAVTVLETLLAEVDPDHLTEETRFIVDHNLTTYLTESGRVDEANRRLPWLRRRATEFEGRFARSMRLDWLEAMIRERQDRTDEAEALYGAARDGFLQEGIAYEAALVSLDLAAMYLDHGRSAEAARLARELSPLLWEGDFHRESVAALMLFQKAALHETATGRYAREVSQTLQRLGRPASLSTTH